MAVWTDIPTGALEPGKPARSVDAIALRDNPVAMAEGAPGAPRIAGQQGPAVLTGGIADGAVTNAKIASVSWYKVTDRPALGAYYSTSEYSISTQRMATGPMEARAPTGYVLTGIRGAIGGSPSSLTGMVEIYNVYARALAV